MEDAPTYAERRAQAVHIFGDIKETLGDRDGKRQRDCSDLSGAIRNYSSESAGATPPGADRPMMLRPAASAWPTARVRYAHLAPEYLRTAVSRLEGLPSGKPADDSAQKRLAPRAGLEPATP